MFLTVYIDELSVQLELNQRGIQCGKHVCESMYYLLMTYVYQHSVKLAEKVKNIRMHYFMPH